MAQRKEDRQRVLRDYYSQYLLQYYGPHFLSSGSSSPDYSFVPFPHPNPTPQINSSQPIICQQFGRNLGVMRPFAPQNYQQNFSTFVRKPSGFILWLISLDWYLIRLCNLDYLWSCNCRFQWSKHSRGTPTTGVINRMYVLFFTFKEKYFCQKHVCSCLYDTAWFHYFKHNFLHSIPQSRTFATSKVPTQGLNYASPSNQKLHFKKKGNNKSGSEEASSKGSVSEKHFIRAPAQSNVWGNSKEIIGHHLYPLVHSLQVCNYWYCISSKTVLCDYTS